MLEGREKGRDGGNGLMVVVVVLGGGGGSEGGGKRQAEREAASYHLGPKLRSPPSLSGRCAPH